MDSPSKRKPRSLTSQYSAYLLFDTAGKQKLDWLSVAACNPNVNSTQETEAESLVSDVTSDLKRKLIVADSMFCNACQVQFADREEQLGHYKCDWHRYNLHRRLKDLPCVSEEEFEAAAGDVSSISGSDDESDDDRAIKGEDRLGGEIPLAETPDLKTESSNVMAERKFHKVFFKTTDGELISLYRCLLHHKKDPLYEPENLTTAATQLPDKKMWAVFMVSAGHFAGAVFNGKDVIEHKTFHRYTVRAKRGTAQSTKDNQGSAPKSGGASLRRYNEAALAQEVQELLSNWTEHIKKCDFVFVRIPVANRGMFYGGKNPVLRKDDPRIRVIPFATRRPTFSETKRVHQMLASVECYGQEADLGDMIPLSPPRFYHQEKDQIEVRKPTQKLKKSGNKNQPTQQPQSGSNHDEKDSIATSAAHVKSSDDEDLEETEEMEMQLLETMAEIDFSELKEFDSSFKRKPKKKKKPLPAKHNISSNELEFDEQMIRWRNSLFTACKTGSVEALQRTLREIVEHHPLPETSNENCSETTVQDACTKSKSVVASVNRISDSDAKCVQFSQDTERLTVDSDSCRNDAIQDVDTSSDSSKDVIKSTDSDMKTPFTTSTASESSSIHKPEPSVTEVLNSPLGDGGTTFLHLAAKEGHSELVAALLGAGADPSVKDKGGKTPYNFGESEVRNAFRRFMAHFPDMYDYAKAQVPSPLTAEMEAEKKQKAAEKRKAKKKANQERNKEKKAAEAKVRAENQEKERFLALSDREKRALAAERRILQQHNDEGSAKPVLSRCWQCGTDITGKVPFEYSDYKFCTTKCLKEHRSKSAS